MASPWLSDDEQRAWRSYLRMRAELSATLNRRLLDDSGLTEAEYGVLVNLSEAPDGRMRAYELGAALQWEKSRLSHQLSRMESRGLVVRAGCRSDGRGTHFTLTDAGLDAVTQAAPLHLDAVRACFIDVLTPEQLEQITSIAGAVLAKLATIGGREGDCGR